MLNRPFPAPPPPPPPQPFLPHFAIRSLRRVRAGVPPPPPPPSSLSAGRRRIHSQSTTEKGEEREWGFSGREALPPPPKTCRGKLSRDISSLSAGQREGPHSRVHFHSILFARIRPERERERERKKEKEKERERNEKIFGRRAKKPFFPLLRTLAVLGLFLTGAWQHYGLWNEESRTLGLFITFCTAFSLFFPFLSHQKVHLYVWPKDVVCGYITETICRSVRRTPFLSSTELRACLTPKDIASTHKTDPPKPTIFSKGGIKSVGMREMELWPLKPYFSRLRIHCTP